MGALTDPTPFPLGVAATDIPAVAVPGAPASPSVRSGRLIPLAKASRGGDVRNPPHPPVRAVDHLTNVHHPVFVPAPDGDAA